MELTGDGSYDTPLNLKKDHALLIVEFINC